MNAPDEDKSRFQTLEIEGWTRQFVAEEPRLSEAAEMYREAGFEVLLEPLPKRCDSRGEDASDSECRACYEGFEDRYKVIFTRPAKRSPGSDDDLL